MSTKQLTALAERDAIMEINKKQYESAVFTMQEYSNAWKVAREIRISLRDVPPNEGIETLKCKIGASLLRDLWEPQKIKQVTLLSRDLANCMYERGFGIEQNLRQHVKGYAEAQDNYVAFWGDTGREVT